MRRIKFTSATCGIILLIAWLIWNSSPEKKTAPQKNQVSQKTIVHAPANGQAIIRNGSISTPINGSKSADSTPTTSALLEEINDAAVMYDPAFLPAIQKYLLHQDPEVRKAAINGMIVLGHREASPMLREASKLAPTPYEAVAMLEAADYLELPSASMIEDGKIKTTK